MFDSLLNILVDITEENISALFNIAQSHEMLVNWKLNDKKFNFI